MALILLLALLAVVFVGLGFVVKWLFIAAVVAALLAVISFVMNRGSSSRSHV